MTITKEQQIKIAKTLKGMTLPRGLGDEHDACSIAAINLALTGELTDEIPQCMSEVIGEWVIRIQDAMPDDIRNSNEWRYLLPFAAGTGRNKEKERINLIMDWMWDTVLPQAQPFADKHGFGEEWSNMISRRSFNDSLSAANAASNAASNAAANAASHAALAAEASTYFSVYDSVHASIAVRHLAGVAVDRHAYWQAINPCALLAKLINV